MLNRDQSAFSLESGPVILVRLMPRLVARASQTPPFQTIDEAEFLLDQMVYDVC